MERACESLLRQTGQVAKDAMSAIEGTEESVLVHFRGGRTQCRSVTEMMQIVLRRDSRGSKLFVDRHLALRRKGYDPRRGGEITPLFCVSEFNSVAGVTVQSCHVFFCATTVVCKRSVHVNDVCLA